MVPQHKTLTVSFHCIFSMNCHQNHGKGKIVAGVMVLSCLAPIASERVLGPDVTEVGLASMFLACPRHAVRFCCTSKIRVKWRKEQMI